jgi:Fe2+ or Zn2+ uptake regulation protein
MDKCNALNLLKSSKIKSTQQRLMILNQIITIGGPFNAGRLYKKMKIKIDLATIYRVLSVFKDAGIIREVVHQEDMLYYELSCIHNPIHPHFICDMCMEISCLPPLKARDTALLSNYAPKFNIKGLAINFNGLCKKCNLKKRKN